MSSHSLSPQLGGIIFYSRFCFIKFNNDSVLDFFHLHTAMLYIYKNNTFCFYKNNQSTSGMQRKGFNIC